jgi:hypothetical protein
LRRGLDATIAAARDGGTELRDVDVAGLRILADHIDKFERRLRHPETKAWDHDPLTRLMHEFSEECGRVFGVAAGADPFAVDLDALFSAAAAAEAEDAPAPGLPD